MTTVEINNNDAIVCPSVKKIKKIVNAENQKKIKNGEIRMYSNRKNKVVKSFVKNALFDLLY